LFENAIEATVNESDWPSAPRDGWRKPTPYRVRGRAEQATLDIFAWARRPPRLLWIVKWPLALVGVLVIWVVWPLMHLFSPR
jgi:hypothetical protein